MDMERRASLIWTWRFARHWYRHGDASVMSHVKGSPDVVGACAEALLPTQRAAVVVHEVAKELPACRHLVALDSLALCHPACKHPQSGHIAPGLAAAAVIALGLLQCNAAIKCNFLHLLHIKPVQKLPSLALGISDTAWGISCCAMCSPQLVCILCSGRHVHNGWTYS